jgi:hypothetical protein
MVATYTQAAPLPDYNPIGIFIHSFLSEFAKVNNLTQFADCADSVHDDFKDVTTAFHDLENGDIKGAIAALTAYVATVKPDLQKCEAAESEFVDVEHYFGQYVKDPEALAKKFAEAEALHKADLDKDVAAIKSAFGSEDYHTAAVTTADLIELVLGPVEQPSIASDYNPIGIFIHSFLSEFAKVNNLTHFADCADSVHDDFKDVTTAFHDLENGDIKGAIASLTTYVATLKPDLQKCEAAGSEFVDVEHYFGQYVKDPEALLKKLTEAEIQHKAEVDKDVAAIKSAFGSEDYHTAAVTVADLIELVLGPVEQPAVFLQ